jgi:ABC-type multidrug transport system ATPase subunit
VTAVLQADSIRKAFRGKVVLSSAWLTAEGGQVTLIAGRNGAGKTTLLKIVAGIIAPDRGLVLLNGERFPRARLHALADLGLWWLPSGGCLVPTLTIAAHADMLTRRFHTEPPDWAGLGLAHVTGTRSGDLSGGERRLAELALAVARQPVCLLADEPLRGLDPMHRELATRMLLGLAATGCAVVATGHEIKDLAGLAGTVLLLEKGETRLIGVGAEALSVAAGYGTTLA